MRGKHWDDLPRWEQVLVGFAQGFAGEPTIKGRAALTATRILRT